MAATTDANGQAAEEKIKTEVNGEEEEVEEEEEEVEEEEEETDSPTAAASADVDIGNEKAKDVAAPVPSETAAKEIKKWPGWPGDNVFRMVVPVIKVGSIIGKKGELIKKICEETRAKVRILDGVAGTTDRVVLIYGKEEPDIAISPAMEAVLRVFKRVSETGADGTAQASSTLSTCSVRLLVPSPQAINLIGKQGSSIKSIQENTGATIRVLTADELPYYAGADERVVDIQGESLKVLKALEAVLGHLRKFLVDHSVLPLFEKNPNASPAPPAQSQSQAAAPAQPQSQSQAQAQDRGADAWSDKAQSLIKSAQQSGTGNDYTLPLKRDSLFLEHDSQFDLPSQRPGLSSLYRPEPPLSSLRPAGLGRSVSALVTQVTQTMQIPLTYAEDIIGVGGANIAYIRRTSGAVLTVQESGGLHDEITVEIKGTSNQVQTAQQLIQDFIEGHGEPTPSSYGGLDTGLRSSYSSLASSAYPSSSLTSHSYGAYGSSGLGGYGSSGLGGYGSYRF